MFHHMHAYFATQATGSSDKQLIVGSILPDMAVTKAIPWKGGLHGETEREQFYAYTKKRAPQFLKIAEGVRLHNVLDDFSHTDYNGGPGYAFQNNQALAKKVGSFYTLNTERATSKAHNYIESAVDFLLLRQEPELSTQYKKALLDVDSEGISNLLGDYFNSDPQRIQTSLQQFIALFTKYDLTVLTQWAAFWADLEKLFNLADIGDKKRMELLTEAVKATEDTWQAFIDYCLAQIGYGYRK